MVFKIIGLEYIKFLARFPEKAVYFRICGVIKGLLNWIYNFSLDEDKSNNLGQSFKVKSMRQAWRCRVYRILYIIKYETSIINHGLNEYRKPLCQKYPLFYSFSPAVS